MLRSENNTHDTGTYFFQLRLFIQRLNKNRNDPVSPHTIFDKYLLRPAYTKFEKNENAIQC